MVKSNGKKSHLFLTLGCMALAASALWATTDVNSAVNFLIPLGNEFAPDASGEVAYNTSGASLQLAVKATNLVADKEYTIKCSGVDLVKAVADSEGTIAVAADVTDAATLQKISDDGKRKFFLWQDSHCLAWSGKIFTFTYNP